MSKKRNMHILCAVAILKTMLFASLLTSCEQNDECVGYEADTMAKGLVTRATETTNPPKEDITPATIWEKSLFWTKSEWHHFTFNDSNGNSYEFRVLFNVKVYKCYPNGNTNADYRFDGDVNMISGSSMVSLCVGEVTQNTVEIKASIINPETIDDIQPETLYSSYNMTN